MQTFAGPFLNTLHGWELLLFLRWPVPPCQYPYHEKVPWTHLPCCSLNHSLPYNRLWTWGTCCSLTLLIPEECLLTHPFWSSFPVVMSTLWEESTLCLPMSIPIPPCILLERNPSKGCEDFPRYLLQWAHKWTRPTGTPNPSKLAKPDMPLNTIAYRNGIPSPHWQVVS